MFAGRKRHLTPSEKMKHYRERLKKDPEKYAALKHKDQERKAIARKLQKTKELAMTPREQAKLADKMKMRETTRKRVYR